LSLGARRALKWLFEGFGMKEGEYWAEEGKECTQFEDLFGSSVTFRNLA